jgi:hypothetical protein
LLRPVGECGRVGDIVAEAKVSPGEQLIAIGLGEEEVAVIGLVDRILSYSVYVESRPYIPLSEAVALALRYSLKTGLVCLVISLSA